MLRKKNPTMKKIVTLLTLTLALTLTTGCDSSSSGSSAIEVTPATTDLAGRDSVILTAAAANDIDLLLPLTWEVENPVLGRIVDSAGLSAVYESTGVEGTSAVTVTDQVGRDGVAVIRQTLPEEPES